MHQAELTVPASLDALAAISDFVVAHAQAAGLNDHAIWEVQLATDEAATNVIQHSYADREGTLQIVVAVHDHTFEVTLRDQGRAFEPDSVPPPDLHSPLEERRTGGLGIYLMHKLMDEVEFRFEGGENVLRMIKRIEQHDPRVVPLVGRIDAATSASLEQAVRTAMRDGSNQIIVDLHDVTFLSSSGLRALLLVARDLRQAGGDLMLCALQPQVAEVFHITGFDQIFELHHTREEAAARFLAS
jgi:anti-anti-sigma factor